MVEHELAARVRLDVERRCADQLARHIVGEHVAGAPAGLGLRAARAFARFKEIPARKGSYGSPGGLAIAFHAVRSIASMLSAMDSESSTRSEESSAIALR
jgi:hypothetical protein